MSKTGEMLFWAALATILAETRTPQPTRKLPPSTKKDKKVEKRRKRKFQFLIGRLKTREKIRREI